MSLFRKLICLAAGVGAMALVSGANAADEGFAGGKFTCLQFTSGLGGSSSGKLPSDLARLWVVGYLSGYYKAQGSLAFSEDAADRQSFNEALNAKCKEFGKSSILGVSMNALSKEARKIPSVAGADFTPTTYKCGQHVDAKAGPAADANKADLAELWAFAFIQGYKNVASPNMEIGNENMPPLLGAINNNCAKNRDTLFMDLTALVAEKVKIAE